MSCAAAQWRCNCSVSLLEATCQVSHAHAVHAVHAVHAAGYPHCLVCMLLYIISASNDCQQYSFSNELQQVQLYAAVHFLLAFCFCW